MSKKQYKKPEVSADQPMVYVNPQVTVQPPKVDGWWSGWGWGFTIAIVVGAIVCATAIDTTFKEINKREAAEMEAKSAKAWEEKAEDNATEASRWSRHWKAAYDELYLKGYKKVVEEDKAATITNGIYSGGYIIIGSNTMTNVSISGTLKAN